MIEPKVWNSGDYSLSVYQVLHTLNDDRPYPMNPMMIQSVDRLAYSSDSDWISSEMEISNILVESFKQVPQIASIYATFKSDGITIWTLLNTYDRDAREAVYKKEMEICNRLGSCDFDFRVSTVELISPKEMIDTGSREIFSR